MYRIVTEWSGFQGAPGYTVLYFVGIDAGNTTVGEAQDCIDTAQAFFTVVASKLPTDVNLQISGEVEDIDPATGTLQNVLNATPPPPIDATGAGGYAAPSGGCISWHTSQINRGRRIRGRSFIVPMANAMYSTTGQIAAGHRDDILAAADAMIQATDCILVVWSRPTPGLDDGISAAVDFARMSTSPAVLRSRRD